MESGRWVSAEVKVSACTRKEGGFFLVALCTRAPNTSALLQFEVQETIFSFCSQTRHYSGVILHSKKRHTCKNIG